MDTVKKEAVSMKRAIYIILFTFLGVLLSFVFHLVLELMSLELLVKNFERYSLGLSWEQWFSIHTIASVVLFFIGMWVGYAQGKKWWNVIYVEKKRPIGPQV